MKATILIRGWIHTTIAFLLAFTSLQQVWAESTEDRLRSILERPGEIQVDDVAFLQGHSKELVSFAEGFIARSGLGETDQPVEQAPLLKLIRMLEPLTDFSAYKLEREMQSRLVGIAARSGGEAAEALCKALLRADDYLLVKIGMEVSAERHPSLLIAELDKAELRDKKEAVICLAINGVKEAVPVLRRVAKESTDPKLRTICRLAIIKIEDMKIPDRFDKSTPQKFARHFVRLVREHPDRYVEEELEFWASPLLEYGAKRWKEYVASPPERKRSSDLAQRLQLARGLEKALKLGDESFAVRGRECIVSVAGKEIGRLYQDMFDQWRVVPPSSTYAVDSRQKRRD